MVIFPLAAHAAAHLNHKAEPTHYVSPPTKLVKYRITIERTEILESTPVEGETIKLREEGLILKDNSKLEKLFLERLVESMIKDPKISEMIDNNYEGTL